VQSVVFLSGGTACILKMLRGSARDEEHGSAFGRSSMLAASEVMRRVSTSAMDVMQAVTRLSSTYLSLPTSFQDESNRA